MDVTRVGDSLVLHFANAEGLHLTGTLQAMVGVTESGECRELTHAEIRDHALILPHCQEIRQLKYAWTGYYEINLFNAAGIPAMPFEVTV